MSERAEWPASRPWWTLTARDKVPEPGARSADPYGDWAAVYRADTEPADFPDPNHRLRQRSVREAGNRGG